MRRALGLAALGPLLAVVPAASAPERAAGAAPPRDDAHEAGIAAIDEDGVEAKLLLLASPWLEGRDSPSAGLDLATAWLADRLGALGFEPAGEAESLLLPYSRTLPAADPDCALEVTAGEVEGEFELGVDFVPLLGASGEAEGPLVFCGFGIDVKGYDDLRGLDLDGAIAVCLSEEPRHPRKLEGPELSPAANVFRKLEALERAGAVGALFVRRPPAEPRPDDLPEASRLGFRHGWAAWVGERPEPQTYGGMPALEVTPAAARRLLDLDVLAVAEALDSRGRPDEAEHRPASVRFVARETPRPLEHHNVVGVLRGADPELADEYVVIGAHCDHVGVDPRGRVGRGADDNASGTAALLEVAEALAAARPARSVLACVFTSEEDGLLGSRALVDEPPVPLASMVAMINLDMIGRGERREVIVLGADEKPWEDLVDDARRMDSGLRKAHAERDGELWQRSDHYSFVERGVPALFLFEHLPITDNRDYHTWRDVPEAVDLEKVTNTARFAFNLVWLLAEEGRP